MIQIPIDMTSVRIEPFSPDNLDLVEKMVTAVWGSPDHRPKEGLRYLPSTAYNEGPLRTGLRKLISLDRLFLQLAVLSQTRIRKGTRREMRSLQHAGGRLQVYGFPETSGSYFSRNSVGVQPVTFLNSRLKWWGYSNPSSPATSPTVRPLIKKVFA